MDDDETAPGDLTVRGFSSDHNIVPLSGITIGGSGANRTITVTPSANRSGTVRISVLVEDPRFRPAGATFVLTIMGNKGITSIEVSPARPSPTNQGQQTDPVDLPRGPQPTSWSQQRSQISTLAIHLWQSLDTVSPEHLRMSVQNVNSFVRSVAITDQQLSLSDDGRRATVSFEGIEKGLYNLNVFPPLAIDTTLFVHANANNRFYALTGDWDGNAIVDGNDFLTLGDWYGESILTAPSYVDLDGSGVIDAGDVAIFRSVVGQGIDSLYLNHVRPTAAELALAQAAIDRGFQSLVTPTDVNGDGSTTALDALNVINRLALVGDVAYSFWSPLDVDGNGTITAKDALNIINRLAITNLNNGPPGQPSEPPIRIGTRDLKTQFAFSAESEFWPADRELDGRLDHNPAIVAQKQIAVREATSQKHTTASYSTSNEFHEPASKAAEQPNEPANLNESSLLVSARNRLALGPN